MYEFPRLAVYVDARNDLNHIGIVAMHILTAISGIACLKRLSFIYVEWVSSC